MAKSPSILYNNQNRTHEGALHVQNYKVFLKIIGSARNNLMELFRSWNINERQRYFINTISVYDSEFLQTLNQEDITPEERLRQHIIYRGYPVFIEIFYDPAFVQLPTVPLYAIDSNMRQTLYKLIYTCGVIGWMEWLIEQSKAGFLSYSELLNHVWLKFRYSYHWNEKIEQDNTLWYADVITQHQISKYDSLKERSQVILEKIDRAVYIWHDHFMGYNNDQETDDYFFELALLDAQQSTDWDAFTRESLFEGIKYESFVDAVVSFTGYTMKQINFANVLLSKHPHLLLENLICSIWERNEILSLIQANQAVPPSSAHSILTTITLTPESMVRYQSKIAVAPAPFLQISQEHYIRSVRGLLDSPYAYLLESLSTSYPKEWSKNVNNREKHFKQQLYSLFDQSTFHCVKHNIIIKGADKVSTDIDAAIVCKTTGEIGLFQLKWQSNHNNSPFQLKSKSTNYQNEAQRWIQTVQDWIESCTESEIASCLGVKKKYVDKQKVYLFVVGRHNGNYSSNRRPQSGCVWSQWYQFLHHATFLSQNEELSFSTLYDYLQKGSPYSQPLRERPSILIYGKYRIHLGGLSKRHKPSN